MNIEETIVVLSNERACVMRQTGPGCNRNCAACDLVLEDEQVTAAYRKGIDILRAYQEAGKQKENEVMGLGEAIEHLEVVIQHLRADGCGKCAQDHEQLKVWLVELWAFRVHLSGEKGGHYGGEFGQEG